nr:hypothetical protein GCM10020185_55630 [Pseudomonas brassicacearum subsp. brassicacearum]
MGMGIASAAGSFGQFAMLPGTLGLIGWLGWSAALLALGLLVALIVPLVSMLKDAPLPVAGHEQTLVEALREACSHSGFWLLAIGFFSFAGSRWCSLACICRRTWWTNTCQPASAPPCWPWSGCSISSAPIPPAGWGRMSKPRLLTGLYLVRAVVIGLFLWLPVTTTTAYLFGMAMGFLWLSTVPLTNGTVATLFGVRNLSMLGGIVFLFHQLGSFLGGWLGGVVYDRTGSYDLIWQVSILLSLLAAALNWPVRERPVARLQVQAGAA